MATPARIQSPNQELKRLSSEALAEELRRDRRLRILQTLSEIPGRMTNEAVLKNAARSLGHLISSDLLRTELDWLAEQGLLSIRNELDLYVATLTDRGLDVASGAAIQHGVSTP